MTVVISGDTGISPVTASGTSASASVDGMTVGRGGGEVSTNTAVGASALNANTTGANSVAMGNGSLATATTGTDNVSVGYYSMNGNNGSYNVGIGRGALNGTGSATTYSTAVGYQALNSATGNYNTAHGAQALFSNSSASNNTAVGYQAGYGISPSDGYTVAIGYQAGYSTSTSNYNTFVGSSAGYSNTGNSNVYIGYNTGKLATSGTSNCFVGYASGQAVTTGGKNTILGNYSGNQGGLDIRTASNNIVLSDGDGNPRAQHNGSEWKWFVTTAAGNYLDFDGNQLYPVADNTIKLGYPTFRWTTVYATTGTINTSDVNQKQDIASLDDAEKNVATAIKSLIKKYRFKDAVAEKGDSARIHIGVIAQEVQAAFVAQSLDPAKYALFCSDTWYEVDEKPKSDEGTFYTANTEGAVEVTRLGIRYDELLAFVIAAM
jgi:hypothetical protein